MNRYDNTIGALVVAGLTSALLLGVTLSKAFSYLTGTGREDPRLFSGLVVYSIVGTTAASTVTASWTYHFAVACFDRPEQINVVPWQLKSIPVMTGSISTPIQVFFAWRILKLSNGIGALEAGLRRVRFLLPSAIVLVSIAIWISNFWVTYRFTTISEMSDLHKVFPVAYIYFIGAAIVDVWITSALIYYLIFRTRDQAMPSTRDALKQVVYRSIQTNAVSLIFQGAIPALLLTPEATGLWFTIFSFSLEAVYTLSLIASLSSRRCDHDARPESIDLSSISNGRTATPRKTADTPGFAGIHVTRIVTVELDVESQLQSASKGSL